MSSLAESQNVRRLAANVMASQKRHDEAKAIRSGPMTDVAIAEFVDRIPAITFRDWYLNDSLSLDEFEQLLDMRLRREIAA